VYNNCVGKRIKLDSKSRLVDYPIYEKLSDFKRDLTTMIAVLN